MASQNPLWGTERRIRVGAPQALIGPAAAGIKGDTRLIDSRTNPCYLCWRVGNGR